MYMQVVSIEHSLARPQAELGDAALSPIFHRVSARCPVLHLFGYVHIPLDDAATRRSVPFSSSSRNEGGLTSSLHTTETSVNPLRTTTAAAAARAASHTDELRVRRSTSTDGPQHATSSAAITVSATTPAYAPDGSRGTAHHGDGGVTGCTPAAGPRDVLSPSPRRVTHAGEGRGGSGVAPDKTLGEAPLPSALHTCATAAARSTSPAPPHPPSHPSLHGAPQHVYAHHRAAAAAAAAAAAPTCTADTGRSSAAQRARYVQRRACLHVHGVYPTLLLPQYDRRVSAAELAAQLEAVVLRVLARQGVVVAGQQLVHDVRVVHRLNVYGYRPHAYAFYEVRLIDPNLLPKVADVLQSTTEVGGRQWQLYDAHNRYHTQFMVRWGINGVAPFELPAGQCHVRLPTAPELAGCATRTCGGSVDAEGGDAAWSSMQVRRCWRPDELGRFTTAEVELDVSGADLRCHARADGVDAPPSVRGQTHASVAKRPALSDNLSYTRRMIRNYFKEHGVPDALRVADTIAMERHLLRRAHIVQTAEDTTGANAELQPPPQQQQQRRYGDVMQLQRADPTVRWLRQRMLTYLAERAEARTTPTASATKLEEEGKERVHAEMTSSAASVVAGPASSVLSTASVGTAAQLREQRAMRQQLVADYRQPDGGRGRGSGGYHHHHHHHHHPLGDARGGATTRVYADGQVDAPPAPPHVPDPHSAAAAAVTSGAVYVGFSSDSLQLTDISPEATPQSNRRSADAGAAGGAPTPVAYGFANCSPTAYAAAAAAPTQELWAALSPPTAAVDAIASSPAGADRLAGSEAVPSAVAERQPGGSADAQVPPPGAALEACVPAPDGGIEPHSRTDSRSSRSRSRSRSSWSSWASWSSASSADSTVCGAAGGSRPAEAPVRDGETTTPRELDAPPSRPPPPTGGQEEDAEVGAEDGGRSSARGQSSPGVYEGPTQRLQGGHAAADACTSTVLSASVAAWAHAEPLLLLDSAGSGKDERREGTAWPCGFPESTRTTDKDDAGVAAGLRLSHPPRHVRIRDRACCSVAPALHVPRFTEGDVVAFVRVRPTASEKEPGGVSGAAPAAAPALRLVEVLAVARVGAVEATAAELQWLLPLRETKWAAEERSFVRRGAWMRPAPTSVTTAAVPTSACSGAQELLMLGEMMLGDVRDCAPASVLACTASTAEATAVLAYAAALSAPTQRLPRREEFLRRASACGATPDEVPASAHRGGGDVSEEKQPPDVRVWPVQCCTSPAAYVHHHPLQPPAPSARFADTRPALRVLCRYAYYVEAQVLTAVPADAFPTREGAAAAGARSPSAVPRRVSWADGDALVHRGAATPAAPASATRVLAVSTRMGESPQRGSSRGRSARARASPASSRVLLTQPQPHHLAAADAASAAAPPSPSSTSTSTNGSMSPPSAAPAVSAAAQVRGGEHDEDAAEDTLLFSSSASSSRSHSGERGDVPPSQAALLGDSSASSTALMRTAPMSTPPVAPRAGRLPTWRLVVATAPPAAFTVGGGVVVHRRVPAAVQQRAAPLGLPPLAVTPAHAMRGRRRPRESDVQDSSENSPASGDDASDASASLLCFSNVSAESPADGGAQQPLHPAPTRPSRGSPVRVSDGEAIVVASTASTSPVASLARPRDADGAEAAVSVRDAALPPRGTLHVVSSQLSPSPSQDAVHAVTASQHGFLRRLSRTRAPTPLNRRLDTASRAGAAVRTVMLQRGGQLGIIADGLPRAFTVSAASRPLRRRDGARRGDEVRVRVSAVTWPQGTTEAPAEEGEEGGRADTGLAQYVDVHEETPSSVPPTSALCSGCVQQPAPASTLPPVPVSARSKRRSSSHVTGLSLSTAQQPQHYLQCVLRLLYVEVLLHRRPGEPHVATSEVLAVALGQATTAADSRIAVQIFCVRVGAGGATTSAPPTASSPVSTPLALTEGVQVVTLPDEAALLLRVRDEVLAYDPDVLLSWEGYKYGLGCLSLRYRAVLQRNLTADLSRVVQHHEQQQQRRQPAMAGAQTTGRGEGGGGGGEARVHDLPRSDTAAEGARGGARAASGAQPRGPSLTARLAAAAAAAASAGAGAGGSAAPVPPSATTHADGAARAGTAGVWRVSPEAAVAPLSERDDADDEDEDSGLAEDGGQDEVQHGGHGGGGRLAALFQAAPPSTGRAIHFTHTGGRSHGPPPPLPPPASTSPAAPPGLTADQYAKRFGANVRVVGRVCTSMGKDLRKDLKMPSYSLPMVHLEVLGQPLPYFADSYLAELFLAPQRGGQTPAPSPAPSACELSDGCGSGAGERETALRYLAARVAAPHRIACKLHWFTKLLEFSRMYGILTEEVITRGSQFKVEATLLRLAEPLGYAMLSPSLGQVHRQPRIECIPLVMQPKSDLYRHDPVVVLDFRSLYPSIIIAYNLCYSTCLGMVQPRSHGRLGVLPRFKQSDAVLAEALPDDGAQHDGVVFTPNGAMFAPPSTRVGLLPRMVQAVLDARFEVQAALKHIAVPAEDTAMQQRLQEQQLALKMLANVTYGYTAASYTGRMPCVDLAEAIVSLGRQTLQRAIALIHSTPEWRAEVVYGDTDSLFVRLAGRSRADAFRLGQAMADAVTASNPAPVRLQFEKVLLPCLLLVKKRYAGYMWTSPTQTAPTFLAKGIEVVRRDQCPVTGQVASRMLRLLFDGASASALRRCYVEAVQRLQSGSANPALCIFRRAVKLGRYGDAGDAHLPLAARLALQQMEQDVTLTPYWGERLPYVVVRSTTSVGKLCDQVLHPERLMHLHDTHSLDASYYITRNVNSTLDRMLYLVGINVAQWFLAMPRRRTAHAALLNLPTFTAAQATALQQQPQYRLDLLTSSSAVTVPPRTPSHAGRLARLSQLAVLMQGLRRPPGHAPHPHSSEARLLAALTGAVTATAAEEISDDDDDADGGGGGGGGVARGRGSSEEGGPSGEALQLPTVEDLTVSNAATQEVIDVELLRLSTQRSGRVSAADASAPHPTAAVVRSAGVVAAVPPSISETAMAAKPRRHGRDTRAPRRRRTVTLDSFYPRTLCVVCEAAAVSLEDVRRQHAVLAHLGIDVGDTEVAGAAAACPPRPAHARDDVRAGRQADAHRDARPPLLLPPICTTCWGDPFTLHLHVQERCRSLGRQSTALRGLCARCIASGGDGGARAGDAYRRAVADMEDMDAFAASALVTGRAGSAAAAGVACVEGSTPRHVLGAVEVSPGGVPRGCVSVDCAVGFEKKWVASQWAQWQAVQAFLQRVL